MSRVRVCLLVLFFVLNVVVQFGDCETTSATICDKDVPPGSDKADPSKLERFLNLLLNNPITKIREPVKNILDHFKDKKSGESKVGFGIDFKKVIPQIRIIFPGTLWCGDGDKAKDESQLGKFNETDACCRTHDKCQSAISAGKTLVNLENSGIFTRSACACDNEFYDCLKKVQSKLSRGIGATYFNLLGQQCFKCVCPTDNCNVSTSTSECKDQCTRYQWVDSKQF